DDRSADGDRERRDQDEVLVHQPPAPAARSAESIAARRSVFATTITRATTYTVIARRAIAATSGATSMAGCDATSRRTFATEPAIRSSSNPGITPNSTTSAASGASVSTSI